MASASDTLNNELDPGGFLHKNENKQQAQPNQPDYIGAANAQSYGTIQAALANSYLNNPSVISPLGSRTRTQTGTQTINIPGYGNISVPTFTDTTTLSPEQQKLYDTQTAMESGVQNQAAGNLSTPFSFKSANDVADSAVDAYMSRLNPQWDRRTAQTDTALKNQGLMPGMEGYDNAMHDLDYARNDAEKQAILAGIQTMPQTLQEEQAIRDLPINELSALQSGSPVNMPQFQATNNNANAQGPQTLTATGQAGNWQQALYNSQVAQQNSQRQGLYGMGGAALALLA